jgi:hypothetical protein
MCNPVFFKESLHFQTPKFTINADYMTFKGECELPWLQHW